MRLKICILRKINSFKAILISESMSLKGKIDYISPVYQKHSSEDNILVLLLQNVMGDGGARYTFFDGDAFFDGDTFSEGDIFCRINCLEVDAVSDCPRDSYRRKVSVEFLPLV